MPLCHALPLFVFPREETLPLTFFCSEISQAYIIIKSVRRAEVRSLLITIVMIIGMTVASTLNDPPLSTPQPCAFLASVFKILRPGKCKGDRY